MNVRLEAPAHLDQDQRALYEAITAGRRALGTQHFALTDADGHLQGPFGLMLHVPKVGRPLQELGSALRFQTALTEREREIAILTVARLTDSEFERYAHTAVGAAAGLRPDELDALATGTFSSPDARENAIAELCARLVQQPLVRPADLVHGLPHELVLELVALVGYYRLLAQMMGLFDVGTPSPSGNPPAQEGSR